MLARLSPGEGDGCANAQSPGQAIRRITYGLFCPLRLINGPKCVIVKPLTGIGRC